jgi:hypothetical protein
MLKLRHLAEVLEAGILTSPGRQHQLLVRQRSGLKPGLLSHTNHWPVVASLVKLIFRKLVDADDMLGDARIISLSLSRLPSQEPMLCQN